MREYTGPTAATVASRLPGETGRPDSAGRYRVRGFCHGHGDKRDRTSLSIQDRDPGRTTGDLFRRLRPADHHRCPGTGHRTNDLAGLDAHRGHTGAFFPPYWCWGAPEPRKQRQRRLLTEDTDRIQMARGVWQSAVTVRAKETDHPAWHWLNARNLWRPEFPLPLRLFVESVLAVSQQDRRSGKPTDLNISLRELLSRLYPWQRTPRPTEYWPRIMQAVHALDSDEARIPILDPDTGRHEMRRIVSVGGIPRGAGHLDDNIRIIVDLPRGSEHGPQVSQNLGKWGLKSAPGYRLLLNLAYAWHDVGRTLTPVGKGKDRRWVRSYDPSRYEKFTDNYLIDLAFPTSARAHRKLLAQDMRKAVTALVEAGEIQGVDGKLLPPKSEKECR